MTTPIATIYFYWLEIAAFWKMAIDGASNYNKKKQRRNRIQVFWYKTITK